mmetsp:Transcript_14880/g.56400  ORF Transcript_14880/g.56400 Transcript_14880/m.56400 type:complete len:273 (-) Transcript_14880:6421-7239(-)
MINKLQRREMPLQHLRRLPALGELKSPDVCMRAILHGPHRRRKAWRSGRSVTATVCCAATLGRAGPVSSSGDGTLRPKVRNAPEGWSEAISHFSKDLLEINRSLTQQLGRTDRQASCPDQTAVLAILQRHATCVHDPQRAGHAHRHVANLQRQAHVGHRDFPELLPDAVPLIQPEVLHACQLHDAPSFCIREQGLRARDLCEVTPSIVWDPQGDVQGLSHVNMMQSQGRSTGQNSLCLDSTRLLHKSVQQICAKRIVHDQRRPQAEINWLAE